jgi:hypothetical protein
MSFSKRERGRQSIEEFYRKLNTNNGRRGPRGPRGARGPQGAQGENADDNGRTIEVFTGNLINPGDVADHLIYTQSSHSGSIVNITLLAHDINSNTNYRFYESKTYWTRTWNDSPTKIDLITPIEAGTGTPYDLAVEHYNDGNDIKIKLTTNITFSTLLKYKIIATITDLKDVQPIFT